MEWRSQRVLPVGVTALLTTAGAAAFLTAGQEGRGQPFKLNRSTIDGGGVMRNAGGDLELSASIGQPDAGIMTGGTFELSGGFWFPISEGDCDSDGLVSLFDYDEFNACLTGPAGDPPLGDCRCFDVNGSGTVDLADFGEIQVRFTGQ